MTKSRLTDEQRRQKANRRAREKRARLKLEAEAEKSRLARREKLFRTLELSELEGSSARKTQLAEAVAGNGSVAELVRGMKIVLGKLLRGSWSEASLQEIAALHATLHLEIEHATPNSAACRDQKIWTIRHLRNREKHRISCGREYTVLSGFGRGLEDRIVLSKLLQTERDILYSERYPVTLSVVLFAETGGNVLELQNMMKHLLFEPVLLFNGTFMSDTTADAWLALSKVNYPHTRASSLCVRDIEVISEYLASRGRLAEAVRFVDAGVGFCEHKRARLNPAAMPRLDAARGIPPYVCPRGGCRRGAEAERILDEARGGDFASAVCEILATPAGSDAVSRALAQVATAEAERILEYALEWIQKKHYRYNRTKKNAMVGNLLESLLWEPIPTEDRGKLLLCCLAAEAELPDAFFRMGAGTHHPGLYAHLGSSKAVGLWLSEGLHEKLDFVMEQETLARGVIVSLCECGSRFYLGVLLENLKKRGRAAIVKTLRPGAQFVDGLAGAATKSARTVEAVVELAVVCMRSAYRAVLASLARQKKDTHADLIRILARILGLPK